MPQKIVALIDADILCYEAASVCEKETRWDDDIHTVHSDFKDAWNVMKELTDKVVKATGADRIVMAISSNVNFRKEIVLPTYKDNRKKTRKPLCLNDLKAKTMETWESYRWETLEGDDVLGILATDPTFLPDYKKIVVSLDKDFKTVPCTVYNIRKDETVEIDEDTADYWHMYQTLTGDTTDGYAGCPSIGPVSATKLLSNTAREDRWSKVVAAYEKAKLSEEVALTMARCAFILRNGYYEPSSTEPVKLWSPT